MNVYQTVMMDLDGTVLTPRNTVTDELRNYLKVLRKRGVHIFAVTGRSYGTAWEVLPQDFPVDGMVTANGMAVYVGTTNIFQGVLPERLAPELVRRAERAELYYELIPTAGGRVTLVRDRPYILEQVHGAKPDSVSENEWLSRLQAVNQTIAWEKTIAESEYSSTSKMYFFSRDAGKIRRWKQELTELSREIPFEVFSSSPNNAEVTAKGVSKASGLRILFDRCRLSFESALAVGDGENDLPMFQIAGHSAAMKNAPDHVKEQADEVTDYSCAENGLCRFLKKTFD
ncbi:HAD family hydrolase [Sporolactobacillus sp. KGMB 08714]|uniref:HAD family hydrolase n=1 Tax=Sporolactobacillus sp. KGMB 08714 TaxID=3064704 RepID=UPI002FBE7333